MTRARLATRAFGAIVVLAAVETIASAFVYRSTLDPEDWEAMRVHLESVPEQEPVVLATDWLGPRARMELPRLAALSSAGAPDLHGASRVHVLGHDGAAWSDALDAELEEVPRPSLVSAAVYGALTLTTYEFEDPATLVSDFVDNGVKVATGGGSCRGAGPWTCGQGRVRVGMVEVDYRSRRCLVADVASGTTVRFTRAAFATGEVLRGHVGFGDFNGRLRNDAPAHIEIIVDGSSAGRFVATDAEGWRPFVVAVDPGSHEVEVALTIGVRGTWGRRGYDDGQSRVVCIEMRSLGGPA